MIKNHHLLSLINEILNRVSESKCFIKLDLYDAYHHIYIKKSNEWKTAFHTWYDYFKYNIMSFRLTNAPVIF